MRGAHCTQFRAILGTASEFRLMSIRSRTRMVCPLPFFGVDVMPRMSRVVCPGVPHHITQRGVRRFNVFLDDADHQRYLELLAFYTSKYGLGVTAYCVMTNHVHVVGVPERENSIAKVFG